MPERRPSPTLRRRRLSAELRSLLEGSRYTAIQVDDQLDWTRGKLARMLRGVWQRPNLRDIKDLLDLFEVANERKREYLLMLARQGREKGWWHPYREMLSERYTTFIGLEAEAAGVLAFQATMVPGLLQTNDYTRALLKDGPSELNTEEIDRRIEVRAKRQELLTRRDPLRLWAVLDEAVLHRPFGGREAMQAQLQHLVEFAELPKVTMQVIPFDQGAHPGVGGPFTILEFPEPLDPDAVYSENIAGELLLEDPHDVAKFKRAFQSLQGSALSPGDSIRMIAEKART